MTEYPTYQSPIRTFEALGISVDSIDGQQLKREKKRLLLEIQISDTQTTTIGSNELGKNDVIELFERLDGITNLNYHKAVYQHPKLLHLLENAEVSSVKIEEQHRIKFNTVPEWENFTTFISPYLTQAIDRLLSKVIRTHNFQALIEIQPFFKLLTETDKFYAFRKLNNFCDTLGDRLEHLAYNNKKFPANETTYLCQPAFYDAVNELATSHANAPNSVAHAIINFTVECERKSGRRNKLVKISDQAKRLYCDAHYKSLITNNRGAFHESREQVLGYNPNQAWRVLVGAVVIMSFVFRFTRACDSDRGYQSNTQDFREILKNMKVGDDGKTYYVSPSKKGENDFNESSFLDLHERVIASVEQNNFSPFHYIQQGDPGILSPFKPFQDDGEKRVIWNETPSDMIMVISGHNSLTSHFVPSDDSTSFNLEENASMFFYGGSNWTTAQTIQHLHQSPRSEKLELIQFNGYFKTQFDRDIQFLKKFFTYTDSISEDFTIQIKQGKYELFQGDNFVNYSY
ncbi:MAG: hypothetical protein AB8B56_20400 [Crocinitomicaceae bacterium]